MKYAMNFQNENVLVTVLRIEHGVLFAKIVARYYTDESYVDSCYLRVSDPIDIIVSGNFELVASGARIYANLDEYHEATENLFASHSL